MDRALDAGIHFFDTANVYGGEAGEGATEKIVGDWLAQGRAGATRSCSPPRFTARPATARTTGT